MMIKNEVVLKWALGLMLVCVLAVVDNIAVAAGQGGDYAVIISEKAYGDSQWKAVAEALRVKHDGMVIRYDKSVADSLGDLKSKFPTYAAFVCMPEEANRSFVAQVHQLCRKLDDDCYGDVIWGIVTGYDAADALRIAKYSRPLVVRRALSATVGAQLHEYEQGLMFNELKANVMWEKVQGDAQRPRWCPKDTTRIIADALMEYKPDVFITSGHATEFNWSIGFSYRNGFFKCDDGQWYGIDTRKNRFDITSPNPKIFMGIGNCLIGHIRQKNCMALSMMRTGGVYQFVGYTIPTGYGYGGWGVKDYFSELQAGRFTLAQANYVNNQALVYELEKRDMNTQKDPRRGLRGDRDVVVLYGDPAWEASMPKRQLPWSQELSVENGVYTFKITANVTGDWDNRPVVHLLENRIGDVEIIEGAENNPIITDNFILVPVNKNKLAPMKGNRGEDIPIKGDYKKGDVIKIVFREKAGS